MNSNGRKILFVINPISGDIEKSWFRDEVGKRMGKNNEHHFFETTGEDDTQEGKKAIEEFQPDTVVAAGGDGTVNLVARLTRNSSLKMGIIPLGSANGLATDLDIPEDAGKAIELLLKGNQRKIDAVLINDKYLSVHICDLGLNARIIKRFNEEKVRGLYGYAKQFLKEYWVEKPSRFTFYNCGKKFNKKAHVVAIANSRMYGTGALINPGGQPDDGKFEVCIIKPYPFYALFQILLMFFIGKLNQSAYVKIISCKKVRIVNREMSMVQSDGEPLGQLPEVSAKILPGCLQVIVP